MDLKIGLRDIGKIVVLLKITCRQSDISINSSHMGISKHQLCLRTNVCSACK